MYCGKCGNHIDQNASFCTKCGNSISQINTNISDLNNIQPNNIQVNNNSSANNGNILNSSHKKKDIIIGGSIGLLVVIAIFVIVIFAGDNKKYNYDNPSRTEEEGEIVVTPSSTTSERKSKSKTIIVYDNKYKNVKIENENDANKLIVEDSVSQKDKCPKDILNIENSIVEKYDIKAVNLCELDIDFAKEIENVIKTVYEEYPAARGNLTNLSLANVSISQSYIAAFMPIFYFATSSPSSSYPWAIKTQVLLNSTYFLNPDRLSSTVQDGSNSGHFPPNATKYSPVAHEFGHYLSFLALMKKHSLNSMLLMDSDNDYIVNKIFDEFANDTFSLAIITEAYNNYISDTKEDVDIDSWRGTISAYALAKDNKGNYIYDETIAESFHDVYLNGDNAKAASKYVVAVLKDKLNN